MFSEAPFCTAVRGSNASGDNLTHLLPQRLQVEPSLFIGVEECWHCVTSRGEPADSVWHGGSAGFQSASWYGVNAALSSTMWQSTWLTCC